MSQQAMGGLYIKYIRSYTYVSNLRLNIVYLTFYSLRSFIYSVITFFYQLRYQSIYTNLFFQRILNLVCMFLIGVQRKKSVELCHFMQLINTERYTFERKMFQYVLWIINKIELFV